ncbi:hypothetical protein SAMN05428949_6375 [Chitinophaga sp. YR627]|uniref:hypothetical protein n=1 Tax=Chitinophaga sp. YR627 TaxID=1881041 RepID=UPI0008E0E20C|nr:hypothetical protein [Chitinophaga sp. YR627]SFO73230.1 hypothetical protein SAMN05428949_6375 [Chitinophaga sp. YR627]
MTNTTIICDLKDLRAYLLSLFKKEWVISDEIAASIYDDVLVDYFDKFLPAIRFVVEFPYVDRVYRDSYYSYYSTKLGDYNKNCIKVSIFENAIQEGDFRENDKIEKLQQHYRGFMVLRPTIPYVIGRSVIDPNALKGEKFLHVTSSYPATVNGVRLTAHGFPHSSQDTETISCAETSVWAIMEYFSSRYPEYKPALPSMIIQTLKARSNVRQIPSEGLQTEQIGFALREFGFATKIYSRSEFGDIAFKRLFSGYVESGMPMIVAITNRLNIAHALVVIGRTPTTEDQIDQLPVTTESDPYLNEIIQQKGISLFDNDDINRQFVFIDDNIPPYQLQRYDSPAEHYNNADWSSCRINQFIVPMHQKMYLEAGFAKECVKKLLLNGDYPIQYGSEIFIRVFITSSRSYKDYLARDTSLQPDVKEFILNIAMPKFIWIGEISDKSDMKLKLAHGLFIIDATEPNFENYNSMIFGGYKDSFFYPDGQGGKLVINTLSLVRFNIYLNNLNGF